MSTVAELYNLAVLCHQRGNLVQAETLYRQVLQSDPAHAQAHHYLGLLAFQTGHLEAAESWLRQALVLNPRDADAHFYFMARDLV